MNRLTCVLMAGVLSLQAKGGAYAPIAFTMCAQDCSPIVSHEGKVYYISEAGTLNESFDGKVTTLASHIGSSMLVQESDGIVFSSSNRLVKRNFLNGEIIELGKTDSLIIACQPWESGKWVTATKKAIWIIDVESGISHKIIDYVNVDTEYFGLTMDREQGKIYLSTFLHGISCYSIKGQRIWNAEPQRVPHGIAPVVGSLHILPQGQSIAILADGLVVKLDGGGGEIWRNVIGDGSEKFAHPGVLIETGLCVATYVPRVRSGKIMCIDVNSGQIKWTSKMDHGSIFGPYFGEEKKELFVVFKDTGSAWYDINGKLDKLFDSNNFISPPFFGAGKEPMFIQNNGTILYR
ncbi:MAG: hypothetical protein WCP35_11680 [Verrucomicrobiota bacterium]